jgi:transposase, IS30 family
MTYQHFTQEERYQIYAWHQTGLSMRAVGRCVDRSAATISRELKRNCSQRGYRPQKAKELASERASRTRCHVRIDPEQW